MSAPAPEKTQLHPRNRHRGRYDFLALAAATPALHPFLAPNRFDAHELTIDFANPNAVKALNQAILKQDYQVVHWDIPAGYLCPPIPGRADYVHHAADLLRNDKTAQTPRQSGILALDIGVGANCIYPLIGQREYGWRFVGSDVDSVALANAEAIVRANPGLSAAITLRLQKKPASIFERVIEAGEVFDIVLCNPPFHASARAAAAGAQRKWKNLGKSPKVEATRNFGGTAQELWCEGGEIGFVTRMVRESVAVRTQVGWFTTLVSSEESLPTIYAALTEIGAKKVETLAMAQGQKKSRVVAWRF